MLGWFWVSWHLYFYLRQRVHINFYFNFFLLNRFVRRVWCRAMAYAVWHWLTYTRLLCTPHLPVQVTSEGSREFRPFEVSFFSNCALQCTYHLAKSELTSAIWKTPQNLIKPVLCRVLIPGFNERSVITLPHTWGSRKGKYN